MPGNEKLTLEIEAKTIGEQAVDKLAASLEKVVNIASKKPNNGEPHKTGYEEFPAKLKDFVEQPVASALGELEKFAKGFGAVGIAAAGSVGAIGAIAAASYEAAKSLGELGVQTQNISIKTGLTTREVGLFTFAAKAAGSDIGVFETAMRKLSQGLTEGGEEGKKANDALSALGIKTRELNGDIRPTSAIFGEVGEAMEHMSGAAERNTLAVKLFGRSGIELVPVLIALKENIKDASEIGLGITDAEQTKFLDIYKKKIEEVDGAWSVALRHFKEGIAGTIWMDISGAGAAAFNYLATGGGGANVPHQGPRKAIDIPEDPAFAAIRGIGRGIVEPPTDWSKVPIKDSLAEMSKGILGDGDAISKAFQAERMHSKEGIEERISELEGKNKESETLLRPNSGAGAEVKQQARDSISANLKLIDGLRAQSKQIEDVATQRNTLTDTIRKMASIPDSGALAAAESLSKLDTLRNNPELLKASGALFSRGIGARAMDEFGTDTPYGNTSKAMRDFQQKQDEISGRQAEESLRTQKEEDRSDAEFQKMLQRRADEDAKRVEAEAGHRDDIAMRGINDTAERQVRMTGIGAQPDDALAVATRQLQIRLAAVEADKQILSTSLDQAGAADKLYALEQRGRDAQMEYNERVADQLAKQQEQFRTLSGSIFDALMGGEKGIAGLLKSELMGIGRTVFENVAQMGEKSIMGDGTAAHPGLIPHASVENSTIGKLFKGTVFGVDPLKGSATALDASAVKLSAAADSLHALAMSPGSGGGSASGVAGSVIAASGDFGSIANLGGGLLGMKAELPGPFDNPTRDPDLITEIDPEQKYGTATPAYSNRLTLSSPAGKFAAGTAIAGGAIGAYEGFSQGGARGALAGSASVIGSASAVMALIPAIASSIPLIGMVTAAALPLISSFMGDPKQERASAISKELTEGIYHAPTAINMSMSTDGTYLDRDDRGMLRSSLFSARPIVTDPYTYWGPNNTPYQAPGGVTSPFTPAAPPAPTVIIQHIYQPGAIQTIDANSFSGLVDDNYMAVTDATAKGLGNGHTQLAERVQYVTGTGGKN